MRAEDVRHTPLRRICERIEETPDDPDYREGMRELLVTVGERADFLTEAVDVGGARQPYVNALIALHDRRAQWVRPLEEWKVRSHNRERQFASLVRHLIARYPVPGFMDSAWLRRDRASYRQRDLYVHIARGGTVREGKTPIPLTTRMGHHFLQAPDHYLIENAIRWGQIHALGGGRRLADAIVATRLGTDFANDEFWRTVLVFFVENPMLDRATVGPIIDYLRHQKYEGDAVYIRPGVREQRPPPQPGLTMKGRTPESLLRQVERWHEKLGREEGQLGRWEPTGIPPFERTTGKAGKDRRTWSIRELLSSRELVAEGRTMRHCVASYARSCAASRCSIWTLEREDRDGLHKLQTVEVNREGVIVQSRGKYNAPPSDRERRILQRWAQAADLRISRYV